MEFSYRITEQDYLQAWKLRRKATNRGSVIKTVIFWVFILVCLTMLWVVVGKTNSTDLLDPNPEPVVTHSEPLWVNIAPFGFLVLVWGLLIYRMGPRRLKQFYLKDPCMQGQYTVTITPDTITTENTAGTFAKTGWNVYESWSESKDLAVLVMRSQAYVILGLRDLPEWQREELRRILASALPRK